MLALNILWCLSLLSVNTNVAQVKLLSADELSEGNLTPIVSHLLCEQDKTLCIEEIVGKNTLVDVHTFAALKYDPRSPLPDAFTICSTLMTTRGDYHWWLFFNLLGKDGEQLIAPHVFSEEGGKGLETSFNVFSERSKKPMSVEIPRVFPHQWVKSCTAINTTSGFLQFVLDGVSVLTVKPEKIGGSSLLPPTLTGNLILGALNFGGHWYAVSNKVTNLNIFSTFLSEERMKDMTGDGSCLHSGDYLSWDEMDWTLQGNAVVETVEKEEPCKGEPLLDLYYTPFPSMASCMHHCQNLGSRVPSVVTLEDWAILRDFLKRELFDKMLNTYSLWLSIVQQEGVWVDFYNASEVLQNSTLQLLTIDGGKDPYCARQVGPDRWNDKSCASSEFACPCNRQPMSYLKLRGLCPNSAVDTHYQPRNGRKDIRKLKFVGLRTSIEFDDANKIWTLSVAGSNVTGTSKATHSSFMIGKHNWTVEGDSSCNGGRNYVTELKMSGCSENQFTCNDGQCLGINLRCDQISDCRDKSDEEDCDILLLDAGYKKKVPPMSSNQSKRDPAKVFVGIRILKVVDIDEENSFIEIQFRITLKWKEMRASYYNLKKDAFLNVLSEKNLGQLWLPEMVYENTDQKDSTRIKDWEWKTTVVVIKEGNFSRGGPSMVNEVEIFEGRENNISMRQTYTRKFQCVMELARYPFDVQVNGKVVFFFDISFLFRLVPLTWTWEISTRQQ